MYISNPKSTIQVRQPYVTLNQQHNAVNLQYSGFTPSSSKHHARQPDLAMATKGVQVTTPIRQLQP
jgi:hypothetical protein